MNPTDTHGTISVAAILAESAKRFPNRIALVQGEDEITYEQLWAQTRSYAGALRERGIGAGDRVALLAPNVPDFVRSYYAILALGAVVVPVHALLKAEEIEYVLRDSGAGLLIVAAPLLGQGVPGAERAGVPAITVLEPAGGPLPRLEDEAARAEPIDGYRPAHPFDTATLLYTSGTTGQPKGAQGSHFALVEQVNVLLLSTFDLRPGDVVLGTLPLFHTFGQTCVLNAGLRVGATIVLVPRFDGDTALRLLGEREVDVFFGVPTMYIALLEAAKRNRVPTSLRYGISGGASIPVAVIERFREVFGAEIYEGYGLTETSPVATFNHVGRPPRPGSIGTPLWGVDVEIARPEAEDRIELLPRGELGELVIRGHLLFKGYHRRPEASEAAVVDGWFRTGDLGTKDDDDYIRILDRKKDMILRNGYNVYPREVEEVLVRHPGVVTAAVYGIPHPVQGQEVAAAVVRAADSAITELELIDHLKSHLASYKYPRVLTFVEALPLNSSGKVLKRELTAAYVARGSAPSGAC